LKVTHEFAPMTILIETPADLAVFKDILREYIHKGRVMSFWRDTPTKNFPPLEWAQNLYDMVTYRSNR
jgi:hypothetical protein